MDVDEEEETDEAAPKTKRQKRTGKASASDEGDERVKLSLPKELRDVMVKDWEQITRERVCRRWARSVRVDRSTRLCGVTGRACG